MLERLQKILSARGICSRRKAEEYIEQGLVRVNGAVATLGQKADPEVDTIEVDGKILEARKEMLYYVMHKPVGVVTSSVSSFQPPSACGGLRLAGKFQVSSSNRIAKRAGRQPNLKPETCKPEIVQTVRDLLPQSLQGKISPVGRLDKDTSGLLLLTNDGVLAYRLTHPKFDHEKEYEVTVEERITDGQLAKLERGITISGTKTKPAAVRRLARNRFRIALTEGRNRQIRRMCQKVGAPVKDLKRVRIVILRDERLEPGEVRALGSAEVKDLLGSVGIS